MTELGHLLVIGVLGRERSIDSKVVTLDKTIVL